MRQLKKRLVGFDEVLVLVQDISKRKVNLLFAFFVLSLSRTSADRFIRFRYSGGSSELYSLIIPANLILSDIMILHVFSSLNLIYCQNSIIKHKFSIYSFSLITLCIKTVSLKIVSISQLFTSLKSGELARRS